MIAGVSDAFAVPDAFAVSETFALALALADEKETNAVNEGIADVDAAVALAATWVAEGAVELTATGTGWKEVPFTRGSGTTSAEELVSGAYHHRVVTPTGNV